MKRFLSVLAVIAVLATMTVSALAVSSPTVKIEDGEVAASAVKDALATDPATGEALKYNGEEIEVRVSGTKITPDEQEDVTETAVKETKADEDKLKISVVDVKLFVKGTNRDVSEEYFVSNPDAIVKVAFIRDDAADVLSVLYQNASGEWDVADFTVEGNKVICDFAHFCNVSFVLKETETTPNTPAPANKPNAPAKRSPQTGTNNVVWMISAAVMLVCACACVVGARKVSAK